MRAILDHLFFVVFPVAGAAAALVATVGLILTRQCRRRELKRRPLSRLE